MLPSIIWRQIPNFFNLCQSCLRPDKLALSCQDNLSPNRSNDQQCIPYLLLNHYVPVILNTRITTEQSLIKLGTKLLKLFWPTAKSHNCSLTVCSPIVIFLLTKSNPIVGCMKNCVHSI